MEEGDSHRRDETTLKFSERRRASVTAGGLKWQRQVTGVRNRQTGCEPKKALG